MSVVSTDYTFSASIAQDQALAGGIDQPIGISAYYSGRAYGPSVVQNPDGTLTMVFAGYRLPKTIASAGTTVGTGSQKWTIGSGDPTMYRSILVETLQSSTTPAVATTTTGAVSPTSLVLGQTLSDTATVEVVSPGTGTPTGTVSFFACGPTTAAQPCTSRATAVGGAVALTAGVGGAGATSSSFTPTSTGEWCLAADYSGDANYAASSDTEECADVTAAATTTVTAPATAIITLGTSDTDTATVTGNAAGGSPTGTVTFYQCGPTATAQPCTALTNELGSAISVGAGAGNTATATSAAFTPTATGFWCLAGYYSGDGNYGASGDSSTDECVDVTTAASTVSTEPAEATIDLGTTDSDTATVTGNAAGGSPTGWVTFYQCGPTLTPEACTSTADRVGSAVTVAAGPGDTATATSVSVTPDATGFWCFAGYYSGDGNYDGSTDTSTDECFDVTTAASSVSTTPAEATIDLGAADNDAATVTGNAVGGSPTGTVSFFSCGPTVTPEPCTSTADPVGSPVTVTAGPGDTATATSPSFTPDAGGYWCFAAYYSGDSDYSASTDTGVDECFDVPPVITSAGTVTFVEGEPASPFQVTSSGGSAPITYTESGTLPSGVTLSSAGILSGTPGFVAGQFPITITATDAGGTTGTQSFTLFVTPSSVLHVTTTSLPAADHGATYKAQLAAAGGTAPYRWSITSGHLPVGLKLNAKGAITGTPKAGAASETFTVQVTDKTRHTATATLTITVS